MCITYIRFDIIYENANPSYAMLKAMLKAMRGIGGACAPEKHVVLTGPWTKHGMCLACATCRQDLIGGYHIAVPRLPPRVRTGRGPVLVHACIGVERARGHREHRIACICHREVLRLR